MAWHQTIADQIAKREQVHTNFPKEESIIFLIEKNGSFVVSAIINVVNLIDFQGYGVFVFSLPKISVS